MSAVNVHAFVQTATTIERTRELNTAVCNNGIKIIVGDTGSGKDRFLDWWWQGGAAHKDIPKEQHITSREVILVHLAPSPGRPVTISCVLISLLWRALQITELNLVGTSLSRPTMKMKNFCSPQQFFRVFLDDVAELMQDIKPRVLVIGNAQYLDATALEWLLQLRTFPQYGRPLTPRCALILAAQVKAEGDTKFSHLMNSGDETKMAWAKKMQLSPMTPAEFSRIVLTLIQTNLRATFSADTDKMAVIKQFYEWTKGNWWFITEMTDALDHVLGPEGSAGAQRIITNTVIADLEKHWVHRIR